MPSFERDFTDHAQALRTLARSLVGAVDADDVVQETALQALRGRPPAAPARSWLLAVLRHRASKLRRSDGRRRAREQQTLTPTPAPTPSELAAHQETVQRLHRALIALPEPYRGTLWQRYFQDRTPAAIAHGAGVPVATVKSRLQRGLQLLRQDLAGDRDDGAWRGALAAAFGIDLVSAAAIAAQGAFLMTATLKISLVGGAAVAALLWFAFAGGNVAPQPADAADTTAVASAAAEVASPAAPTARTEAPAASPAGTALPAIRVRLVDVHDRAPLPHYALRLVADGQDPGADASPDTLVQSDDRGEFELDGRYRGGPLSLLALDDADGATPWREQRLHVAADAWPPADRHLELELRCGPTYRLVFADAPPSLDGALAALTADPQLVFSSNPVRPSQRVRGGALPWVRFDPALAVPSELGAGPITLVVADAAGTWVATGTVDSVRGVQANPVVLRSQPCGALRIAITEAGASPRGRYHASVYRRGDDGRPTGRDHTVQFAGGTAAARIPLLPIGDYRVFVGGGEGTPTQAIDVAVRAGEETRAVADFAPKAAGSSLRVVARSASGERDLGIVVVSCCRPDGTSPHHAPADRRDGALEFTFADLGPGEWVVRLQPTPHLPPWDRREHRVDAAAGTVEFVCLDRDAPPPGHCALQIVDARDRPIAGAGVTTFVDGHQHFGSFTDSDGNVTVGPYLTGRTLQVLVRAADCEPAFVDVTPVVAPATATRVRLLPGWGTMFVVMTPDRGDGVPLADVEVLLDGVAAGRTDRDGLLLVRSASPPRRIELRRAGYRYDYGALDAATGAPTGGEQSPYFCAMRRDR